VNLPNQGEAERPIGSNLLGLIKFRRSRESDFDNISHRQRSGCLSEGQRFFWFRALASDKKKDAEPDETH